MRDARLAFLPDFPLLLAPLAGVSDLPFRLLCRAQGCDLAFTEMVSAKGLSYRNENTQRLLASEAADRPLGVQLFGSDPALMAETAKRLCESMGEALACIDVNMGCPVHKVVKNGEGSALMRDPALAGRIMAALVKAAAVPVTAKFRKGFDEAHGNAVAFARILEDNGAAMLTVHGRTRAQMYGGAADYGIIGAVKAAVRIPVIGNGDIYSAADALRMREETGCDGVMAARGAMGNPFLFAEIRCALSGEAYTPPTAGERIAMAMEHTRRLCAFKGPQGAVEMRKHAAWYIRGLPGAAQARVRLSTAAGEEEMLALLEAYGAQLAARGA